MTEIAAPFDAVTSWMQQQRDAWTARLDRLEAALRAEGHITRLEPMKALG